MKEKKDKVHEHFVNDDPTEFDQDKLEDLAKEAIKKFKSASSIPKTSCGQPICQ